MKNMVREIVSLKKWEKNTGIRTTDNHTGKMCDMISLSTSSTCNPTCKARQNMAPDKEGNICICAKCYAQAMQDNNFYRHLTDKLVKNSEILSSEILTTVPALNVNIFRFEAFGDLINETHFINYLLIAYNNPWTIFSIWTKNPGIMKRVFNDMGYEKPDNLIIILSSPYNNVILSPDRFPFVDKVFTVWDTEEKASNAGITINCGKRHCFSCRRCYTHNANSEIEYIHELLK